MDMKSFAENDFDPKKWINRAWNTNGAQEKEVFVANTVARLQLYMKQLSNSLDETTTQIVSSVPRILQDASTLQVEGSLLQQKLLTLEQQVRGVQEQTGHSIESLQRIDQLKSRLENAASALKEADKWAALASSLEDILDSGVPTQADKLEELADQVGAMTASLEVLADAPDYETKRVQLETLYNRLEAAISPPLIDALTQMDAERTSRYALLAARMARGGCAARCWRRALAARLAAAWRRAPAHSLRALARLLPDQAGVQVEWLTNVLKCETPLAELLRLYTDVLLSLDPTPTKVVTASFKLCQTPEEGLDFLRDVRRDIDELVHSVRRVLDAPPHKERLPAGDARAFGRAAYGPLRALLPAYTELQAQLLLAHLDHQHLQQEGLLDYSRGVLSLAERCEGWLNAAYATAREVAGDAAYHFCTPAVEAFVAAVLSLVTRHTRRLEAELTAAAARGQCPGVLGEPFPAALALQHAVALLAALLAALPPGGGPSPRPDPKHPLEDLATFLLAADAKPPQPEASWCGAVQQAAEQLRPLARQLLTGPVHQHLDKIPQLPVWHNNDALSTDLPDFALSPQEYITEIGQYLMTLPQHLEMHLSEKQSPWQFLNEVCTHTSDAYAEKILNIRNMDALGTRRCLTDIVYLSSVIEDLGSSITPSLRTLEKSLRAATPSQNE